ncbi:Hypothetical protein HVR_LOCUS773 [uncultured virus]|nr:Hypothetical protein HVR_LOCUS773 [uncultured virus]
MNNDDCENPQMNNDDYENPRMDNYENPQMSLHSLGSKNDTSNCMESREEMDVVSERNDEEPIEKDIKSNGLPDPIIIKDKSESFTVDNISSSTVGDASAKLSSPKRSILPSEITKIKESVLIGSVFLALTDKIFTPQALLNWLTTIDFSDRTQIAYKAACLQIEPNSQYMEDGFHFLVKKPEYTSIAVGCGLNPDISDQKVDLSTEHNSPAKSSLAGLKAESSNPVLAHICDALAIFHNSREQQRLSSLILAGKGTPQYIKSKLVTCYRARNFPHLQISANEINVGLVSADWTARFRYNEQLPRLIIRRVAELQAGAPIYYAEVAYKAYNAVALKLNKEKLLTHLTKDELATFDSFFPNIIDRRILTYTDLAYKIALLGNDVAGYVLGFPIQNVIPDESHIATAIDKLISVGVEKYADDNKVYLKTTYTPILPFPCGGVSYPNETDVLGENIDNYVPFDVIAYQTGGYLYRFSRAEFDKLAESKKNPWTNEWLPPTVLSTIEARAKAAKELGLPEARPLVEMLDRIESGTLFEPDPQPTPQPQPQVQTRQITRPIELLMAAALAGGWNPGLPMNADFDGGEDEFFSPPMSNRAVFQPGESRRTNPNVTMGLVPQGTVISQGMTIPVIPQATSMPVIPQLQPQPGQQHIFTIADLRQFVSPQNSTFAGPDSTQNLNPQPPTSAQIGASLVPYSLTPEDEEFEEDDYYEEEL